MRPNVSNFALIISALQNTNACYILGAGASYPLVALTGDLPSELLNIVPRLGSFPVETDTSYSIYELFGITRPSVVDSLTEWKAHHTTKLTLEVILRHLITDFKRRTPYQYLIFRRFPESASIICFNWDRLARHYCPQKTILYPHGLVVNHPILNTELADLISWTQEIDNDFAIALFQDALVLPGEEEFVVSNDMKDKVSSIWRTCSVVVAIGYSFGLLNRAYDKIWRELFIEAMSFNQVPIHFISPTSHEYVGELREMLKRSINVFSWELNWYAFSRAVLKLIQSQNLGGLLQVTENLNLLLYEYGKAVNSSIGNGS